MSMQVIHHEVALMLSLVKIAIADAERQIAAGTDRERVHAAGELSLLRRQSEELQGRLAEIERRAGAHESVYQWLKEEVFNLSLRLESWIAHG